MNQDEDKIRYVDTIKALAKAEERFHEILEKESYDSAYWDIEFTAYLLNNDFKRIKRVTLEREIKK